MATGVTGDDIEGMNDCIYEPLRSRQFSCVNFDDEHENRPE